MTSDSMFGDPRFQPPAFSTAEIMDAFSRLAIRRGFFHLDETDWLVPIIQHCDARNVPWDKMVRIARDTDPDGVDRLFGREPGTRYQRPSVDIEAELSTFADSTGLILMTQAGYMVPILTRGLAVNEYPEALASQIKTAPPLIDVAAKREAGINTRLKIGASFADSLTDTGRQNPAEVAKAIATSFLALIAPVLGHGPDDEELLSAIMLAPFRERRWRRDIERALESGNPLRLSAISDQRTCVAAKAAHGTIYELDALPMLPLASCGELDCRCMWLNLPRRTAERSYGYRSPVAATITTTGHAPTENGRLFAPPGERIVKPNPTHDDGDGGANENAMIWMVGLAGVVVIGFIVSVLAG